MPPYEDLAKCSGSRVDLIITRCTAVALLRPSSRHRKVAEPPACHAHRSERPLPQKIATYEMAIGRQAHELGAARETPPSTTSYALSYALFVSSGKNAARSRVPATQPAPNEPQSAPKALAGRRTRPNHQPTNGAGGTGRPRYAVSCAYARSCSVSVCAPCCIGHGDTAAPLRRRAKGIIIKELAEGDCSHLPTASARPSDHQTVGLTPFLAAPPGCAPLLRRCCCSGRCTRLWLTCVLCRDHRPSTMIGTCEETFSVAGSGLVSHVLGSQVPGPAGRRGSRRSAASYFRHCGPPSVSRHVALAAAIFRAAYMCCVSRLCWSCMGVT